MNGRRFFDCRKWIKAKKTSARGRNRAVTTRKDQEEVEVLRGSLHGVARVLQAAKLHLRVQEAVPLPGCRRGPGLANKWVFERPRRSRTRPSIRTWIQAATDLETRRKFRELKRKLSERALTQRKARAREEPSPGPPASETDARPPGHQPRGGAPARPRLSRGQEGPT